MVGGDEAGGVRAAGLQRRGVVVDDVAAEDRDLSPSTISSGAERGLANWPAMRPTLTTGVPVPYVSTTAICRMTLSLSRMLSAVKS